MSTGESQAEWFKSINPNSKMPALVHVKDDGTSVTVFESAACLLYIASEFDKEHMISYPVGTPGYWTQLSWVSTASGFYGNHPSRLLSSKANLPRTQLSWQVAGYGPMMGQASHFNRYCPEPVPYGSWRYTAESRRLNQVLDDQLVSQSDIRSYH